MPENLKEALNTDTPLGEAGTAQAKPLSPRHLKKVVKPGSNAYSLLVDAGLSPKEVADLTASFSPLVDISRCRPGEKFVLMIAEEGSIKGVAYQKTPLEIYEASRRKDGWEAIKKAVPYNLRLENIESTLESSLFQSLESLGEKDSLAIALIDILAWEIDFAHESRRGDSFSVIVEKYYVDDEFVEYGPIIAASYRGTNRNIEAYSLKKDGGGMDYFDDRGRSLKKSFLKSPLRYTRITSSYSHSRLHPITGRRQPHYAIDYAAPRGTPVWAVADGTVHSLSYDRVNGRMIVLSHPGDYQTYYLHLNRYSSGLKKNQRVSQKKIIGYVGTTGWATGSHLDYRMKKRGRYINPLREDFPRADPVAEERLEEFGERVSWLATLWEKTASREPHSGYGPGLF